MTYRVEMMYEREPRIKETVRDGKRCCLARLSGRGAKLCLDFRALSDSMSTCFSILSLFLSLSSFLSLSLSSVILLSLSSSRPPFICPLSLLPSSLFLSLSPSLFLSLSPSLFLSLSLFFFSLPLALKPALKPALTSLCPLQLLLLFSSATCWPRMCLRTGTPTR